MVLVVLIECTVFNAGFWTTMAASTDTASVMNTMGPGLKRTTDGLLEVTDETQAYLDVAADGTSHYARVDPLPGQGAGDVREFTRSQNRAIHTTAYLRLDPDGQHGSTQSISLTSPRSLYLRINARSTIRVWVQESRGTLLPIEAVRANVRVPFRFDLLRVIVMLMFAALIMALRPGSRLWAIRLDPSSVRQRWLFAAFALPLGLATLLAVVIQLRSTASLTFHAAGGYTYDFDIYGHMADSLLHGHLWLDLPTPDALQHASNPYDTAVRERLLSQGVSPIYWDYAWYHGHWYSYFGVLPALVLFAPYRLLSSIWVPGGAMAPAAAAVILLAYGFVLFGSLLVIRVVHRIAPRASLASTSMAVLLMIIGSNIGYLVLRTNFYSIPFVSAMMLSSLGTSLWLSASGTNRPRRGVWQIEGAPPVSLPRLAGGSVAISATLACRPTFALTALLGLPIFWPQIRALARPIAHHMRVRYRSGSIAGLMVAVLLPALICISGVGIYNVARFGSPLNFGIEYQLTVTDMTSYPLSVANLMHVIGYYLALPLHFASQFPFLTVSPTPLPQWGFTEPMVGGLFVLCPLLLCGWATPFLRRFFKVEGAWRLLTSSFVLGLLLIVVDGMAGGLGWRYMADFGWLLALAATGGMLVALGETGSHTAQDIGPDTDPGMAHTSAAAPGSSMPFWRRHRHDVRLWCVRLLMLVVLMACIVLALLSTFVQGRDDALVRTDPSLFYAVHSWFMLL